jgi:hypothetical protein
MTKEIENNLNALEGHASMIIACANRMQHQTCYHNFYDALADLIDLHDSTLKPEPHEMDLLLELIDTKISVMRKLGQLKSVVREPMTVLA